jgi:hypothetical protein
MEMLSVRIHSHGIPNQFITNLASTSMAPRASEMVNVSINSRMLVFPI